MSSETTNWEAIGRYLAGESSAAEQAAVRQWLAEHPADAKTISALDDALGRVTLGPNAVAGIDVEGALAKVKGKLASGRAVELTGKRMAHAPKVIPLRPRGFEWVPLVAAAAMVLIAGAIVWRFPSKSEAPPPTTIAARTLSTPVGGRDSLVLPDGSQVTLGPGSSLIMAQGYGQSERRISLTGEALFTVTHDAAKPFVVVANGVEIRDVGTAFVVHSDGSGVRVAVTEGVVDLKAGGTVETLKAGDAASVSAGKIKTQRGVGASDDLAWTTGRLVFRDAPLSEVAEDLKRWYGVTLDIRDPALRRRPLSASYQGDSLRSVLENISLALGASMERRGDTVVVRSAR